MKKICVLLFVIFLTLTSTIVCFAQDDITVRIDGSRVNFDVTPQIINDRTMVPLRAIFEAMGLSVNWDEKTSTVTSEKENVKISITVGEDSMYVNDEKKHLDSPALIKEGRTLVPVRAISEAFGAEVGWEPYTKMVTIKTKVRMVDSFGNEISVSLAEADSYLEKGYKKDDLIPIYSLKDGAVLFVYESRKSYYTDKDWTDVPVIKVYSLNGETLFIKSTDLKEYEEKGWYSEPYVTMYNSSGEKITVRPTEVAAKKALGFSTEPFVLMYAEDGRTLSVLPSEVEAHKNVGWYLTKYEANMQKYKKSDMSAYAKLKTLIIENGNYMEEHKAYMISTDSSDVTKVINFVYFPDDDIIVTMVGAAANEGVLSSYLAFTEKDNSEAEGSFSVVIGGKKYEFAVEGYFDKWSRSFVITENTISNYAKYNLGFTESTAISVINYNISLVEEIMNALNSSVSELGVSIIR